MKTIKNHVTSIFAISLLAMSANMVVAYDDQNFDRQYHEFKESRLDQKQTRMFKYLDLSEAQQESIKDITMQSKDDLMLIRQKIHSLKEELKSLDRNTVSFNEKEVIMDKVYALKKQQRKIKYQRFTMIQSVLTPEQQLKVEQLRQKKRMHHERPDRRMHMENPFFN